MDVGCKDDLESESPVQVAAEVSAPSPPDAVHPLKPQERFAFVDGLRGLAALGVVLFHIWTYEPDPWPALQSAHWVVDEAFRRARDVVQILLVISGFVIAYTLRKTWVTVGEGFSFMVRRIVRLGPAYWVTIATIILVAAFCEKSGLPFPYDGEVSLGRVAAHVMFLQDVLGYPALSAGVWTLCIEMQFYLVAILGWGLAQRMFPLPVNGQPRPSPWGLLLVFGPLALASLFYWRKLDSTDPWVTHFMWSFFLGMMTWWTLDRNVPLAAFVAVLAIGFIDFLNVTDSLFWLFGDTAAGRIEPEDILNSKWSWRSKNAVALSTAMAIFLAGRWQQLHVWLNVRPLQYVGKISYSLYLIHFPVFHLLTSAGWKWCDNSPSTLQARVILLSVIPASLIAGHLLYVLVELPSARWSARLKQAEKVASSG
jgi:peptidoglycan/LPS O-acetylase OafA/YrhL